MTDRAESAFVWYDADVNGYIVSNDDDGDGVVFAQTFAKSGSISHQHDALVQAVLKAESFGYIVENYDGELGCIERDDHNDYPPAPWSYYIAYDYHQKRPVLDPNGEPMIFTRDTTPEALTSRIRMFPDALIIINDN